MHKRLNAVKRKKSNTLEKDAARFCGCCCRCGACDECLESDDRADAAPGAAERTANGGIVLLLISNDQMPFFPPLGPQMTFNFSHTRKREEEIAIFQVLAIERGERCLVHKVRCEREKTWR